MEHLKLNEDEIRMICGMAHNPYLICVGENGGSSFLVSDNFDIQWLFAHLYDAVKKGNVDKKALMTGLAVTLKLLADEPDN